MIDLSNTTLRICLPIISDRISALDAGEVLTLRVADPDHCVGCYAGSTYRYKEQDFVHRSWHSWSTLAHLLHCRISTPRAQKDGSAIVNLYKLDTANSFHTNSGYDTDGIFARIDKLEEPDFLHHYALALREAKIHDKRSLLDLGAHDGTELSAIRDLMPDAHIEMTGIDIEYSAIEHARSLDIPRCRFHHHDINQLDSLGLDRFDLILSIATLQSPSIETKPLIMNLTQNYLHKDGAFIIAYPNSRWIDGELITGAKAPNYRYNESSLLIKDIYWIKKYLQQHRFRVRIFGQSYIWIVATRILDPKPTIDSSKK